MKIIDQWNELQTLIEQKEQEFISQQEGLPTEFYEVYPNGKLNVKPVLKVVHINYDQYVSYSGKKPSRDDLQKLQSKYYNLLLDEKHLRFRYDQYNGYGLEQIDNVTLFIDKSVAEIKAKEITDRIAEEERLLAGGGYDRCQRCSKVVPKEQIITSTIIGRDRNAYGKAIVTQTPMRFCGGECAAHEQWSREG